MSGAEFHTLTVRAVDRLTDESVAVEFEVPPELSTVYDFVAGQHVIVRHEIDGQDVRRSYSLCAPAGSGRVRVGVKQVAGGVFSTFANKELRPGMQLEVTTPTGEFTALPQPAARRYCAIAAGSGITPVLSLISTLLRDEPESEVFLIYGNRHGGSVMFLEELADLKDRHLDRFSLTHVLSREMTGVPLFNGRLSGEKIHELFDALIPVADIDRWFLCGPLGVVENAQKALADRGVADQRIATELFFDERPPEIPTAVVGDAAGSSVRFTLGGRTSELRIDPDGPPILDYVVSVRSDAPFSCRNGACASCRALVLEGEATMHHNWCLTDAEVAAGQILTCQAHPVTDVLELTYDL
ncbi:MAG: 2Fe-2S iron-sulfur cluster binding domain-containing protein [Acidimicrobiia bacterium]|nr:2Fe-2S iron-sulfur cluster binding domain-containing protein [Acidimicrobiia bacterium]